MPDVPVLIREPALRPPRTLFENSTTNRQAQLFSRGLGELPGQSLLFDPLDCGQSGDRQQDAEPCER